MMNETEKKLTIEEMDAAINEYIGEYWGMSKAEELYRSRCNTWDDDYDRIKEIYDRI